MVSRLERFVRAVGKFSHEPEDNLDARIVHENAIRIRLTAVGSFSTIKPKRDV